MDKNIDVQLKYRLKPLIDTKSDEFYNALRIYSQNITHDQKTNTNEITYWINHIENFSGCTPFFFALLLNNQVIGYAELAYIKEVRILAIDYIVLDNQYKSNSAFYAFYHLIINYIDKLGIDYDFITKEILCRFNQTKIHKEDIRIYELENFKVINALYIHPQLETNNAESRKEALLMLYQKDQANFELKSETYMSLVKAIYFQYYEIWDAPFWKNCDESNTNHDNLIKNIEEINATIENSKILLNGYPMAFSTSSDRAVIPENLSQKYIKKSFIYASIILVLTFLILFFSKELNIQLTTIAIVAIAILFVILTFVALSDSKAAKIIEKLPVFSKLFALLK
ncbi:hypothetical protein [Candidatus Merdisoma sp. JLR.KK006]|jgi:hypothetical protein|uniref:hypothetical protein n=1 Tax=Candidatus Merdisoma sp. JLR.KK006 TaxID=3112626 RepID=UPI002FEF32E6